VVQGTGTARRSPCSPDAEQRGVRR